MNGATNLNGSHICVVLYFQTRQRWAVITKSQKDSLDRSFADRRGRSKELKSDPERENVKKQTRGIGKEEEK